MKMHLKDKDHKLNALYEQYTLAKMMGLDPQEQLEMETQILLVMSAKLLGFGLADAAIAFVEQNGSLGMEHLLGAFNNPAKNHINSEIEKLQESEVFDLTQRSNVDDLCSDCESIAFISRCQWYEEKKDPNHGTEVVMQYIALWEKFTLLTPLISAIAQKPNAMEIAKRATAHL